MHLYRFKDEVGSVIYIGKSVDVVNRLKRHFSKDGNLTEEECHEVFSIDITELNTRIDMDILELLLINRLSPKLNVAGVYDEKSTLEISYDLIWVPYYTREDILDLLSKRKSLDERIREGNLWVVPAIQKYSLFKDSTELNTRYKGFLGEYKPVLTPAQLSTLEYLLNNSIEVLGVSAISKYDISEELGLARRTIVRACNRLESLGIIKQEGLIRPLGGISINAIYFIPKDFDELIDVV